MSAKYAKSIKNVGLLLIYIIILETYSYVIPRNYLMDLLNIRSSHTKVEDHHSSIFLWFIEPNDFSNEWHWEETYVTQDYIRYQPQPDDEEKASMYFKAYYHGYLIDVNQYIYEGDSGWDMTYLLRREIRNFSRPFSSEMEVFYPDIDIPIEDSFIACEHKNSNIEISEWTICRMSLVQGLYFGRFQIGINEPIENDDMEEIFTEFVMLILKKHLGE